MKKNIYFISLRIKDWLHVLGLTILGIGYYKPSSLLSLQALMGLIIASLYLAHGYSLNTCIDATIEPYWNKMFGNLDKNFFKKILLFSYALFFINCIISLLYSKVILYFVVIGSISCLIYSFPPLRLKRYLLLSHLLNSSGFSILFIIGFLSLSKTVTVNSIIMSIFFAFLFIPLQIIHQLSHYTEEEKKGSMSHLKSFKNNIWRLFTISLALIIFWSLLMCKIINNRYIYYFYPTCIFVLLIFYFMRRLLIIKGINTSLAIKTRMIFRKICIGYGLFVLLIYSFLKQYP